MQTNTREQFEAFVKGIVEFNQATNQLNFNVLPSVSQKLEAEIQESDAFLKAINIIPVTEKTGQKVLMNVGTPVASRTDTSGNAERQARNLNKLSKKRLSTASSQQ